MLKQAHGAVLRRVLALALSETGLREDLTYAHYAAAMALLDSDNPSARVDLPKGYCMERQYENLKIGRTKAPAPGGDSRQSGAAAVAGDVRHFSGEEGAADSRLALRTMTIGEYNALRDQLPTEGHAAFDADAMGAAFGTAYMEKIRMDSRKPGDYLPLPGGKSKKIQDYLVDCKVPKGQRDGVRLVKLGNEVLWIPPQGRKGRYSANYKLCEKTKNVICIEIICDI
jgi:hypothetical protein